MDKSAENFQDEQSQKTVEAARRYIANLEQQVADLKQAYIQLETQGEERIAEMDRLNQALAQEVIERIEAEKSLVEERRLLHDLMDNIPDAIYFKDIASRFTRINRAEAKLLGIDDPNVAVGKSDADFQAPELAKIFIMEEKEIITSGQSVITREEWNPAPDGTSRWFSTTKVPIKDADGHVNGIVGISRDITHSKQLQQEAQRFQFALEGTIDGVQIISFDWKYIYLNDAAIQQGRHAKGEYIGHTMMALYPGIERTPLFDKMRRCMEQRVSEHFENQFTFPDGTSGWFDLSIQSISEGIFILSTDISERKRGGEALRENEAKLQTIFTLLPVGASVINAEKEIVQVNVALEKILNLSMDDVLKGKYKSRKYIHPDGTPMLATELPSERAIMEQQAVLDVEIGVIIENGTTIWTSVSAAPLPHNQGVVTVTVDITERKNAEAALRESEMHLRLLAQNSPDVIYILDLNERRATYLNRTEFLGYSQSEVESTGSLLYNLHPDDNSRVMAHWQELINDSQLKGVGLIEYRLRDKAEQWQWVQSRERIFASTADGKPTQILVTLTVITHIKQAQQQALELEKERERVKLLSDFIRNISHDFRTPLTIIGSSAYLLSKSTDPEKKKGHLDNAEKQISHLTRFIDRLLEMGRLDSQSAFTLQRLDVNQLVSDFCAKLAVEAKKKDVTLITSLWESDLIVQADSKELNLAFSELGKNAVGYTPPNGTITIYTRQEDNQAVIEVCDTGIGISETDLPHIFERLFRVDKARAIETGGAGLGLALAKRIIELHQGTIMVESVIGEGSIFRVSLPLSQ